MRADTTVEFSDLPSEDSVTIDTLRLADVGVHATDWTTETIVSQLRRGNILLNPRFQRRDAWSIQQKSRFVESLILGLPIPQVVLAEVKEHRGKFIVLDGKQRLLALLQFWGLGAGEKNAYRLSGLEVRTHLQRKQYEDLENEPALSDDLTALHNQTIRTVVIKNWPDLDFLHLVFLRLNTGSVKLSPQELRQAAFPGPFTDFVDECAATSGALRKLLNIDAPDYRMRDIELLARYLSFRFFLPQYRGRMKHFLDLSFGVFNKEWQNYERAVNEAGVQFEHSVSALMEIFGQDSLARKPGSRQFNRAIFDVLMFYAQDPVIAGAMLNNQEGVRAAYAGVFDEPGFAAAVERDTAGIPSTLTRLSRWGSALQTTTGELFNLPKMRPDGQGILFNGFWGN